MPTPPIIIKKKVSHGGHHGGAWKVAYADFVTAMMCFFLVMWLMGADEETKATIAHYFNHPNTPYHEGRDPKSDVARPMGEKTGQGDSVAYALWYLEERGSLFIDPGVKVYQGMIIGENSRDNDLEVNPLKEKQLSNIRTTSKDEAIRLTPPRKMSLEQAIAYVGDDELVEITPAAIRLRKKLLDPNERRKEERRKEAERV